jgi:hypothetical protein
LGNGFHKLSWANPATVRFLGGTETVGVFGGFVPGGVFEFTVGSDSTAVVRAIPELADAALYATLDDGSVLFVSISDGGLYRWTPGSAPVAEPPFDCADGSTFAGITDLGVSGQIVAAVVTCIYPDAGPRSRLVSRDLGDTVVRSVGLPADPVAISGVPAQGRLIVEAAGDLWLVALR